MPYITETYLTNVLRSQEAQLFESRHWELAAKSYARVSIFLSHCHKDSALVQLLNKALVVLGQTSLYVDWQDSTLPRVTNRETAQKIKERIAEMDCFLILATKNAMESKWVPWEIGIADTKKQPERIAIIPIADPSGTFHGNEYLQLYQRIVVGEGQRVGVFMPNESQGPTLASWLAQFSS